MSSQLADALLAELIDGGALEEIAQRVAELLAAQAPPTGPRYLSTVEAAEHLRCEPKRIYNLVSSGRLRRFKDGSRNLFAVEDLDALIQGENHGH